MPFDSFTFLLFLLVVLLVDRLLPSWRARKANLLLMSYLFYSAWNPPFVLLLILSTVVDWFAAKFIARSNNPPHRRLLLYLSLLCNLGVLSFFKYGQFALDTFVALLDSFGITFEPLTFQIVLPVGISFYTFQTLSYTIDVFRRKQEPSSSFLDFALYVTFFPQLVAGPIVRASMFLPQCAVPRRADHRQLGWGFSLLTFGIFQKVVLADSLLAPVADQVYGASAEVSTREAWLGTLAFSGQIFFDFAGYSLCAIATALCLGFSLPDNFRCPYAAVGFSDFWRRWHISLSSWLRDYLYIPLGGNRCSARRTYLNLMLTMLIGGLWHGASWRFVVWGGMHGMYLAVERRLRTAGLQPTSSWTEPLLAILTFLLVSFTWVFFRAVDFGSATAITKALFGWGSSGIKLAPLDSWTVVITIAVMCACQWWARNRSLSEIYSLFPVWLRVIVLSVFLITIACAGGDDRAFIYFQF